MWWDALMRGELLRVQRILSGTTSCLEIGRAAYTFALEWSFLAALVMFSCTVLERVQFVVGGIAYKIVAYVTRIGPNL